MGVYYDYDDDEATHTLVCMPVSSGGQGRVSQPFNHVFAIFVLPTFNNFLCCFGSHSFPILMVKFLKSNLRDHISTIWETLRAAYYGAAYHAYLEEQFLR